MKRTLSALSKTEWLLITIVLAVLVAIVPPTPHHRETRRESCHLCGNCRLIVRDYRWWQVSFEATELDVSLAVAEDHVHKWWQYGSSYVSYNKKWAASHASRYRDGRITWTP
ncbi:MAG: hypothetical protein H6821_09730 [Planctomycetaceae bacterium]|nr:hypothetical protein [Planctomycetales bacterium]MCB9874442.1 hypothetical protein [Planctomycetaceae bacterium]MCB9940981.1 hypothetical protein [Planctomycetaceae bacterium]HRX82643.1 hypothetical protein [Pirellulaceae bacterium]